MRAPVSYQVFALRTFYTLYPDYEGSIHKFTSWMERNDGQLRKLYDIALEHYQTKQNSQNEKE